MTVITRFAPSPTGYLHIGGARTALYNWLYAKANGGKFLLRIEDTDRERSTQPAIDAILRSMRWLGMDWDGDEVYQFARASRHAEVAEQLVKDGKAYYCYTSSEELAAFRAANPHAKYRSPWREGGTPPADIKPVIRLKAPITGETIVNDGVKGTVSVQNSEMDDMVLLRSDGTPTYMLAVVVDDHDMNVSHVIRGDDHFTNTFRQIQIYDACGWSKPHFSHIPMILGADGAKLSKRHGALGVEEYQKMGFLPEALNNYLLRLGWSHGDDEIISQQQAIEWFNLEHISSSPARFDMEKLKSVNAHYMRTKDQSIEYLKELPYPDGIKRILSGIDKSRAIIEAATKLSPSPFESVLSDIDKNRAIIEAATKSSSSLFDHALSNSEKNRAIIEAATKSSSSLFDHALSEIGINSEKIRALTQQLPNEFESFLSDTKKNDDNLIKALTQQLPPDFESFLSDIKKNSDIIKAATDGALSLLPELNKRSNTLVELADSSAFLFEMQPLDEKAQKVLDDAGKAHLKAISTKLENTEWEAPSLEAAIKEYITESGAKFPAVGMPIRAALTGTTNAPAVHEIMAALGKDETIARLKAVL